MYIYIYIYVCKVHIIYMQYILIYDIYIHAKYISSIYIGRQFNSYYSQLFQQICGCLLFVISWCFHLSYPKVLVTPVSLILYCQGNSNNKKMSKATNAWKPLTFQNPRKILCEELFQGDLKASVCVQQNYNTPVEHTPGKPPSPLRKESLYSLLVKV